MRCCPAVLWHSLLAMLLGAHRVELPALWLVRGKSVALSL